MSTDIAEFSVTDYYLAVAEQLSTLRDAGFPTGRGDGILHANPADWYALLGLLDQSGNPPLFLPGEPGRNPDAVGELHGWPVVLDPTIEPGTFGCTLVSRAVVRVSQA